MDYNSRVDHIIRTKKENNELLDILVLDDSEEGEKFIFSYLCNSKTGISNFTWEIIKRKFKERTDFKRILRENLGVLENSFFRQRLIEYICKSFIKEEPIDICFLPREEALKLQFDIVYYCLHNIRDYLHVIRCTFEDIFERHFNPENLDFFNYGSLEKIHEMYNRSEIFDDEYFTRYCSLYYLLNKDAHDYLLQKVSDFENCQDYDEAIVREVNIDIIEKIIGDRGDDIKEFLIYLWDNNKDIFSHFYPETIKTICVHLLWNTEEPPWNIKKYREINEKGVRIFIKIFRDHRRIFKEQYLSISETDENRHFKIHNLTPYFFEMFYQDTYENKKLEKVKSGSLLSRLCNIVFHKDKTLEEFVKAFLTVPFLSPSVHEFFFKSTI